MMREQYILKWENYVHSYEEIVNNSITIMV